MSKFDLSDVVGSLQDSLKKDPGKAQAFGLGSALTSVSLNPEDYVAMPSWFKENYGVLGFQYGNFCQWAGEPDSGKTSMCLAAMKQAQDQGNIIVYVETEGKTGEEDLISAGIDPKGVLTVHTSITEHVFDLTREALDTVAKKFPGAPVFLAIDSYGNTTSMRDSELELSTGAQKPGGHAKTNRMGLGMIKAKMLEQKIACLVVNYTYDNIGSVGKTNAGGKALNFWCQLIIQSSRKAWYERTVNGQKVRAGADVLWKVYKNHYAKTLKDEEGNQILLPKQAVMRISAEGINQIS